MTCIEFIEKQKNNLTTREELIKNIVFECKVLRATARKSIMKYEKTNGILNFHLDSINKYKQKIRDGIGTILKKVGYMPDGCFRSQLKIPLEEWKHLKTDTEFKNLLVPIDNVLYWTHPDITEKARSIKQ